MFSLILVALLLPWQPAATARRTSQPVELPVRTVLGASMKPTILQRNTDGAFVAFPAASGTLRPRRRSRARVQEASTPVHSHQQYMLSLTTVLIGSPAQAFNLIVDTGSSAIVVPSLRCDSSCASPVRYDPSNSFTSQVAGCDTCNCVDCRPQCRDQCGFESGYSDGASAVGLLYSDVVRFGNISSRLTFSALTKEQTSGTSKITMPDIHGIVGLGPDNGYCSLKQGEGPPRCYPMHPVTAFCSQNRLPQMFSLYVGDADFPGVLVFGGNDSEVLPEATRGAHQWVPFADDNNYHINVHSLLLDGTPIIQDQAHLFGPALVDSGTNMMILADEAFEVLQSSYQRMFGHLPAVSSTYSIWNHTKCQRADDSSKSTDCRYCLYAATADLGRYPDLEFVVDEDVRLRVPASRYFWLSKAADGTSLYCLGITSASQAKTSGSHSTLFGYTFLSGYFTTFDLEKRRVGFAYVPHAEHWGRSLARMALMGGGAALLALLAGYLVAEYRRNKREMNARFAQGLPTVLQVGLDMRDPTQPLRAQPEA
eukprot:RCo005425